MKDKIMKGKMTKRVLSFILTLVMVFSLMPGNVEKVQAAEDVTTVGTLKELKTALGNDAIHRVIVSKRITLPDGTNLDGHGKTVQVEVPYLEESGATSDSPSNYNVFTVDSGANVTIKNMQIFGGQNSSAGGIIIIEGTLALENITIARSCRGLYVSDSGKAVLKNTNIVRNQCKNGGGILCTGGTLVMDGCSLTENRSTDSGCGGGAMEIIWNGSLYANNTVIANNSSDGIGGAISNYESNVYLMNCQVIGNVTTEALGGGLGINCDSAGLLKAVNSIFKDNYFIENGTGTPENGTLQVSDVGIRSGSGNKLINCIYGKIQSLYDDAIDTADNNKEITEDSIFTNYRNDGVLYGGSNDYTTAFKHPALRAKDGNSYALYANPSDSGEARSGGVDTYFDYSDLANVKMSYGPAERMNAMTTNPADASCKVTTYYEGGERTSGVIGASAVSDSVFYTVKLGGVPSHGTVQGISIYGDSYASGTSVTVSAIPDTGYAFKGWKNGEEPLSTAAEYTFTVTNDLSLTAEFFSHNHLWNYKNGTDTDANKLYAYCSNGNECPYAGSEEEVSKAVSLTLSATSQIYSGSNITKTELFGTMDFEAFNAATGLNLSAENVEIYKSGESTPLDYICDPGDYVAKLTVDTNKTAACNFTVNHQEQTAIDPGTVTATAPTVYGGNDGKIAGVTTDYEYSIDGGVNYISCEGTEITGLLAGIVKIRKKAKTGYHPSPAIDVTVPQGAMPQGDGGNSNPSIPGGGNSNPSTPSGGNSTPSTPSGGDSKPSTPTEEYTILVESENAVEVKAEIKEGTADVSEITEETLSKVTDAKGESNVNTIKIDLSGAKQEVTGVTISKKSVETLAKATNDTTNGIDTVTIELSKATVVLDTKTLETLVEDAKGTNIRLVVDDKEHKELNTSQQTAVKDYHVATSFEAYFESDGVRIHDFKGGKATVSIEFTPETGKSIEHYHMVYLPDAGGMTRFKTKYENGQLIFTTTHFSDYAVIYDENEKNETGNEEEKPVEQKPAETQVAANAIAINKGLKVSQTGTKINVSWGKAADADGYLVYAAYCGTDFGNAVKTIKDPSSVSTTITKINGKKLDLKKNFKVYVKAYKLADGKKVAFGTSITAHITGTKNAKNTNVKELKLTSKSKLTLAVGKTSKIKAKVVLVDSAKKQLSDSHTKEFRYASSNKKVAAVDKNGKITAKAKGTCYIYVYARNGYAKKVTVTVN